MGLELYPLGGEGGKAGGRYDTQQLPPRFQRRMEERGGGRGGRRGGRGGGRGSEEGGDWEETNEAEEKMNKENIGGERMRLFIFCLFF